MENLTISDAPPQQGGGAMPPVQMMPLGPGARPPPQQQQLPAQMFTTAAQLLDLTDSMLCVLWDNAKCNLSGTPANYKQRS
jgi:U6 snRNA-associated Sm-like protein LSm1